MTLTYYETVQAPIERSLLKALVTFLSCDFWELLETDIPYINFFTTIQKFIWRLNMCWINLWMHGGETDINLVNYTLVRKQASTFPSSRSRNENGINNANVNLLAWDTMQILDDVDGKSIQLSDRLKPMLSNAQHQNHTTFCISMKSLADR